MFRSFLSVALLSSVLASGAMAASATTYPPVVAAHPTTMVHKNIVNKMKQNVAMKKMLHHCKKGMHMVKGKCTAMKTKKMTY
jgi:hypothetical protein